MQNIKKEVFLSNNNLLKEELRALSRKEEGVFIDGAFYPSKYYDSSLKLLWILKEPHGDALDYPEFFTNEFDKFFTDLVCGVSRHTWATIAKISSNILNGYAMETEHATVMDRREEIQESLSKIAFININKDSSDTGGRSLNRNVTEARRYYDDFLERQIDHLCPDMVICGNTFQFLRDKYGFPEVIKKKDEVDYVDHYFVGNTLYLDPYHPAYLAYGKISEMSYINDIVRTVKDNSLK